MLWPLAWARLGICGFVQALVLCLSLGLFRALLVESCGPRAPVFYGGVGWGTAGPFCAEGAHISVSTNLGRRLCSGVSAKRRYLRRSWEW